MELDSDLNPRPWRWYWRTHYELSADQRVVVAGFGTMLSSRPSKSVTKSIIRNMELNGSLESRPTPQLLAGEPAEEEKEDEDDDDEEDADEDQEDDEDEEAEEVETYKVKKGNVNQSTYTI